MRKHIRSLFGSSLRDRIHLIVQLMGTALGIANIVASVFLYSHGLDAGTYGSFSIYLTVILLLSGLGEIGASNIILARLPSLLMRDPTTSQHDDTLPTDHFGSSAKVFLKSICILANLSTLLMTTVFVVTYPSMDLMVYKTGFPLSTVILGACAVFVFLWKSILTSTLLALQKIVLVNALNASSNIVQLVLLYGLYVLGGLTVDRIFLSMIVVNVAHMCIFLLPTCIGKWQEIHETRIDFRVLHLEMIFTNFFAQQIFQMALRTDLFIFSYLNILTSRADYALAQKIVLTITAFIGALIQLYTPEFARIKSEHDLREIGRKRLPYFVASLLLFGVLFLVPEGMYTLFFTTKFPLVSSFTRLLSFVYMVYVLYALGELVLLYSFKDARAILWSNIVLLITTISSGLVLVSRYGYIGGAVGLGIGLVTATCLRVYQIKGHLRKS